MWIQILFTKKSFKQGNSSQYKLQLSCRYKVKRCNLQIQARQDTDFLQQMIYFFPQNIFKFSLLLQLPQILRKFFWIKFDLVIIEPLVQNLFIITYLFQSLYIIEPEKKQQIHITSFPQSKALLITRKEGTVSTVPSFSS